jgi:hypothetical protein
LPTQSGAGGNYEAISLHLVFPIDIHAVIAVAFVFFWGRELLHEIG